MEYVDYTNQKERLLEILSRQLVRGNTLGLYEKLMFSEVQLGDGDDTYNSYIIAKPDHTKGSNHTGEARLNFNRTVLDVNTKFNTNIVLNNIDLFIQQLEENNVSSQEWASLFSLVLGLPLIPSVDILSVTIDRSSVIHKNNQIYSMTVNVNTNPNSLLVTGSLSFNPFAPINYELDESKRLIYVIRNKATIEAYKDNGEVYPNFTFLSNAIEVDSLNIECMVVNPDKTISLDGYFKLFYRDTTDGGDKAFDIEASNITIDIHGMIIGYKPTYKVGQYPLIDTIYNPNAQQRLYHTPMSFSMNIGTFVDTASETESLYTTTFKDYVGVPLFAVDNLNRLYAACSYLNYNDDGMYHHRIVVARYHEGELDETYTPFMIERFDLADPIEARPECVALKYNDVANEVTFVLSQAQELDGYKRNGVPLLGYDEVGTVNPVFTLDVNGVIVPNRTNIIDGIGSQYYGLRVANSLLIGGNELAIQDSGTILGLFYRTYPKTGYVGYYPVRFSNTGVPILEDNVVLSYPWVMAIEKCTAIGNKLLTLAAIGGSPTYEGKLAMILISDDYPIFLHHAPIEHTDSIDWCVVTLD